MIYSSLFDSIIVKLKFYSNYKLLEFERNHHGAHSGLDAARVPVVRLGAPVGFLKIAARRPSSKHALQSLHHGTRNRVMVPQPRGNLGARAAELPILEAKPKRGHKPQTGGLHPSNIWRRQVAPPPPPPLRCRLRLQRGKWPPLPIPGATQKRKREHRVSERFWI